MLAPPAAERASLVTPGDLSAIVRVAAGSCDAVVISLPREIGDVSLAMLEAADHVLEVLALDVQSFRAATRALEVVTPLRVKARAGFVVNRARRGEITPGDVERVFGAVPWRWCPRTGRCRGLGSRSARAPEGPRRSRFRHPCRPPARNARRVMVILGRHGRASGERSNPDKRCIPWTHTIPSPATITNPPGWGFTRRRLGLGFPPSPPARWQVAAGCTSPRGSAMCSTWEGSSVRVDVGAGS